MSDSALSETAQKTGLRKREWASIALMVLFIAGWVVLMFLVPPDEIVEKVGVENTYGAIFVLSILGALGSMTTFSSYPAMMTAAAGGMSPLALGVVSGIGLTIGDAIFYYLVGEIKGLLRGRAKKKAYEMGDWLEERPRWVIPGVTYVWVGMLPLPNNILTGALSLSSYPFWKVLVPILLGNLTFPIFVAYTASMGIELFS